MSKNVVKKNKWLLFSLSVLIVSGLALGIVENNLAGDESYERLRTFTDILRIVEKQYVEEVELEDLYEGAIRGMLKTLDPHTSYMSPDAYMEMQVETKGSFGGLGIEITIRDGKLTVVAPIDGTPAARAGIKASDWIAKVEGKITRDMTLMDAVKLMRGPKGTKVTLTIMRKEFDKPKDFSIIRDIIKIKNISYEMLEADIGYLKINQFQERSDDELKEALEELNKQNKKALILDLRNNPGGLLDMAVSVADIFLEKGKMVVSTKGRVKSANKDYYTRSPKVDSSSPMIILVNAGSASASEIVAGALQDWGKALILGEGTFGKGSVQTVIQLNDNSGLRLTTARYYTPKGHSIHAKGIVPDIEVEEAVITKKKNKAHIIREKELLELWEKVEDKPSEKQSEKQSEKEAEPEAEPKDNPSEKPEAKEEEKPVDVQLQQAIQIIKANLILQAKSS